MSKNKPLTVSALKAKLELLESVGAINGDTVICRYDKGSPTFDPFDADADLLHSTEKVIKTLQWNADEHMNNIAQLSNIFMNDDLLDALAAAKTPEDILKAEADFPCEED